MEIHWQKLLESALRYCYTVVNELTSLLSSALLFVFFLCFYQKISSGFRIYLVFMLDKFGGLCSNFNES